MPSSAGQQLVAGRIPGERIATTEATADSADVTGTEAVVMSVTAPLVSGRTYRVTAWIPTAASAADNQGLGRIRLGTTTGGSQLTQLRVLVPQSGPTYLLLLQVEHTAASTADTDLVATMELVTGTGSVRLDAAAGRPAYMYVDYIEG